MLRRWRKRSGLLFDLFKDEQQFLRHFPLGFLCGRLREDEQQNFALDEPYVVIELSALLEIFFPWCLG
jgi:hypothetical protein